MAKIKYGQIGVGHPHANKLHVYRESNDYEVVGIVEGDERLRAQAQASAVYRDVPWMSLEQLLNVPDLKVVGIESGIKQLLDYAESCIAAGKHIHLDKPAGESLTQFRRVLDEAARRHAIVQMGYMYRYNPAIVMLRDWLRRGWLGEPFEVHAVMSKRLDRQSRRELTVFRGGAMFELGCHLIDLVVGLVGVPEAVHAFPRHSSQTEDDQYLDNMLAVFEYPRATATVRSSMIEVDGFARRHFVLCGSEGTFHIQPLDSPTATIALRVERPGHAAQTHVHTLPAFTRYVADAADLARLVRHEKEADFTYEHDFQVQRAVFLASGMSES